MTLSAGTDIGPTYSMPLVPAGEQLELSAGVLELGEASISANTRRAYASDLRAFVTWCAAGGRPQLPASPEKVAEYLVDRAGILTTAAEWRYAPSTMTRWLSAISAAHTEHDLLLPGQSALITRSLNGIRHSRIRAPKRADPLLFTDVQAILDKIGVERWPAGVTGIWDRLLILIGWAGTVRRTELADLRVGDVIRHRQDGLQLLVRRSKTDQEGRALIKAIPCGWGSYVWAVHVDSVVAGACRGGEEWGGGDAGAVE